MKLHLFSGLHPADSAAAAKLVCPPYDAISRSAARDLLAQNTCTFLRVIRPDACLPDSLSDDESATLNSSSAALDDLQSSGLLTPSPTPSLFVYELHTTSPSHTQRGVAALLSVDDYTTGTIRRHEHTVRTKEEERASLAAHLSAHTGPVLLAHRPHPPIAALIRAAADAGPPDFRVSRAGATHSLWRVTGRPATALISAFGAVSHAYILDGHHRAAGAARVAIARRAAAGTQMHRASDWFPGVLFPADELRSLPYYRTMRDLGRAPDPPALLAAVRRAAARVTPLPARPVAHAADPGVVYMALRADARVRDAPVAWYAVHLVAADDDPDVRVLHRTVLGAVLGATDARADPRVEFVPGTGLDRLDGMVRTGEAAVVFAPRAMSAAEVMNVVDAGEILPPKSTWFEPKLWSGFLVHTF